MKIAVCFAFAWMIVGAANAQSRVTTRTEQIQQTRQDKIARLWPERESPLVDAVNKLVERGLYEGIESGKGSSGWQVLFGGMRSGQGQTFGFGYRRSDMWRDTTGMRASARGTMKQAYMLDYELDFKSLTTERSFVNLYAKYENSPQMAYYGPGPDSSEDDRSSYRLEDLSIDLHGGAELFRGFHLGLTGGWLTVHTGPGSRSGFPSTEEIFDPEAVPGLMRDTDFLRFGAFIQYDHRDIPSGAKRGGLYAARFRQYDDQDLKQFSFRQAEFVAEHYFPYYNGMRVVAVRVATVLSFESEGQQVPFYLQPRLGGNDDLRSFARYRFYDDHMIYANLEHRWHAFTGLDMAVFIDAGKVIPSKADVDFGELRYGGGIGFRFKIRGGVFMRIDFAVGSEGFRWMWTFNDIFKFRWRTT